MNQGDNKTPTEQSLNSLAGFWSFDVEKHLDALVPARTLNLCLKIDNILINFGKQGESGKYGQEDMVSLVRHLEAHSDIISIGEFMNCFDIASNTYNEISQAIFGNVSDQNLEGIPSTENDEMSKMRLELIRLKELVNVQQIRQEEQTKNALLNHNKINENSNNAAYLANLANQNAQNLRNNEILIEAQNNSSTNMTSWTTAEAGRQRSGRNR